MTHLLPILAGIGAAIIWFVILDMPFRIKLLFGIKPWKSIKGLDCLFCATFWLVLLSVGLHYYLQVPEIITTFLAIIAITKLYTNLIEK